MRPVNLIPAEDRRDGSAQLRGGPLAYIVVGALAILLIGVVLLVDTGNKVSAEKEEITRLQSRDLRHGSQGRSAWRPTPTWPNSTTAGCRPSPPSPPAASTGNG